jgi:energy-coupling factor transporter ATP-binding protein EcfA2
MPEVSLIVECPVHRSFRVEQLSGIFDLSLEEKLAQQFRVEVPDLAEDWQIGLIVGPSGSGKSTIARQVFGDALIQGFEWPADKAVLDGFAPELSVQELSQTLSAVGFSSPPSWVKPYHVLSNGEKFRCDLARALLLDKPVVAYDEFTSVVDRTVARIGSAAVSKAIRKGRLKRRFVAVTCHYDVAEWLEPDWEVDMASSRLARGRLWRPKIELEVAPVHRSAWLLFGHHHYLSGSISNTARCFVAFWNGTPVAFSAWMNAMSRDRKSGDVREHRSVVLPDYQGLGIGHRLSTFCASIFKGVGRRAFATASHPVVIRARSASPHWKRKRLGMSSPTGAGGAFRRKGTYRATSAARITAGFEYVGPALDRAMAEAYLAASPAPFAKRATVVQVESLLRRYPGATPSLLARVSGLSASSVRNALDELVTLGDARQEGTGRGGDRLAFYPTRCT